MIRTTLAELAEIVGGRLVNAGPEVVVTGPPEYDSRNLVPGGLFVAFAGEKADGHDYAEAAVAAGAAGVLGSRDTGQPGVVVADPLVALARLANVLTPRLSGLTVVGLTGSSGKTTTKDFIGQLLAHAGETVATPGSLNNELGFPCTALKATPQTRFLVLEMGARGIGHIAYLAGIVTPRIGVVLNVGDSHIGEFGSLEGTAKAKGELVECLPPDGVAVLNADDPRVRAMSSRTQARVVLTGESPESRVRAEHVTLDDRGRAAYTLVTPSGSARVTLRVPGRHQVANTLAAAAVGLEAGLTVAAVAEALGGLRIESKRRMDVFERADGVTVIDDSYNANPASMAAALRALASMGERRRTIAVLGYMAELGDHEAEGHAGVGRLAAELGVDRIVAVAQAAPILDGARDVPEWKGEAIAAADQAEAIAVVTGDLRPEDVVLVKGSRYRTWDVVDALRAEATGEVGP